MNESIIHVVHRVKFEYYIDVSYSTHISYDVANTCATSAWMLFCSFCWFLFIFLQLIFIFIFSSLHFVVQIYETNTEIYYFWILHRNTSQINLWNSLHLHVYLLLFSISSFSYFSASHNIILDFSWVVCCCCSSLTKITAILIISYVYCCNSARSSCLLFIFFCFIESSEHMTQTEKKEKRNKSICEKQFIVILGAFSWMIN